MDKYKVIVADDEVLNREILSDCLKDRFDIVEASNGIEVVKLLQEKPREYIAILLDLQMPEMDGFDVLRAMQKMHLLDLVPVIVITGEKTISNEKECFEIGATDFIEKPFESCIVQKRVENVSKISQNYRYLKHKVLEQTVKLQKQYEIMCMQNKKLKENNFKIIDAMGTVVEFRHLESGEHIQRVKLFTRVIANYAMKECPQYYLTPQKVEMIEAVSSLHDLGKIAIPDKILEKPGKLTKDEFDYMKSHTIRGCALLNIFSDLWEQDLKKTCYDICRYHHERYDGNGYPDGLLGEEIPVSAQIVSIADVYDALVSERVYKKAYTKAEAYTMIINGECGVFSPYLLECFRHARKELEQIVDKQKQKY